MKRHLKKIAISATAPLILLLCVFVFYSRPNDYVAGYDLVGWGLDLLTPLVYLYPFVVVVNLVDHLFDVYLPNIRWGPTIILMGVVSFWPAIVIFKLSSDTIRGSIGVVVCFLLSLLVIFPMRIWRRTCWNIDLDLNTENTKN